MDGLSQHVVLTKGVDRVSKDILSVPFKAQSKNNVNTSIGYNSEM